MIINGKAAAAALVKARGAMRATVVRDARGNFGKYADLAAVMEAITPALSANGLALVQEVEITDADATVMATLVHESGETIEFSPLSLPVEKRAAQAIGAVVTYARRYQLTALFGLAPDDDLDAQPQTATAPQDARKRAAADNRAFVPPSAPPGPSTQPEAHVDDAPPVDEDGPFADSPEPEPERAAGDKMLRRLHAIGTHVYGGGWDGKRHEIVAAITGGRTHSSAQLTEAEARRMIAGMEAKWAVMSQPDYAARQRQEAV